MYYEVDNDARAQNYYGKAIIIYILELSGRISRETACFCHSSMRVCVISINKGKQAMTTSLLCAEGVTVA